MPCLNDKVVVQDVSEDRVEMMRWALASFKQESSLEKMRDVRSALVPKHISPATWRRVFGGRNLKRASDALFVQAALNELAAVADSLELFNLVLARLRERS